VKMYPPNWGNFDTPVIMNPNSAAYGARGADPSKWIDWGKVRLNFSYDDPESRLPEDNVVFLEQPEQDNTMLYILGGVAGFLGLILLLRR